MAVVERFRDRAGREVVLPEARIRHILDRRPRMADRLGEFRPTVEALDLVTRDSQYARRENHYRRPAPDRSYLKVVVQYLPVPPQGTSAGDVITAHPIERIDAKEEQLWP